MTGKDIIFLSDMDWDDKRRVNVHHTARLLASNHRVFYIDNFGGLRGLTLKDVPRVLRKLRRILSRQLAQPPPTAENPSSVVVFQPFNIPAPRFPNTVGRANVWLLGHALRRLVNRYNIRNPIIWATVPSDVVWHSIRGLQRSALVYQSVDRFPYSPMIPEYARPRLKRYERLFCESADLVFASAYRLYEEKRQVNPNTYFFPNGVDPEMFSGPISPSPHLAHISRPIVGFVGSLGPWVDYTLLTRAAAMTPEWSFVIVGPVNPGIDLGSLKALPNVHFTGAVAHAELPSYLAGFDCGLIPYLLNDFTVYTFPSKMAEYLAAGLPVVSTPLPELQPYANVVSIIRDPREMINAIRQHLADPGREMSTKKRIDVARTLSWESMVSQMEALIDNVVRAHIANRPGEEGAD